MPLLRPFLLLTTPPESSDLAVGTPRAELIGVCVLYLAGDATALTVTQVTLLLDSKCVLTLYQTRVTARYILYMHTTLEPAVVPPHEFYSLDDLYASTAAMG